MAPTQKMQKQKASGPEGESAELRAVPRMKHSSVGVMCVGVLIAKMRGTLIAVICAKCGQTCAVIHPAVFYAWFPGENPKKPMRR